MKKRCLLTLLIATTIFLTTAFQISTYAYEPTQDCQHEYAISGVVDSTCSQEGYTQYICIYCDHEYKQPIAKKPHNVGSKLFNVKKATFSSNGYTGDKKCSVCGNFDTKGKTVYKASSVKLSGINYWYDNKVHKPTVTVTNSNNVKLKNGTDYTLKYSNANSKASGKYTVTVTLKGNYSGAKTFTYYIFKPTLSSTGYTYDGKIHKPDFKITYGDKVLSSKYYTFKYSNKKSKAINNYTVTTTLKGKFKGSKTITYSIGPNNTTVKDLTAKTNSIAVKLNKKSGISGYRVQIATNSAFTKNVANYYISRKNTSKTINGLKSSTTYYVRVRTYKTVGDKKVYAKNWSKIKSVKTKLKKYPSKPSNLKIKIDKYDAIVSWDKAANASGYSVVYDIYNSKGEHVSMFSKEIKNENTTSFKINLPYYSKCEVDISAYHTVGSKKYYSDIVSCKSGWNKKTPEVTYIDKNKKLIVETKYSWQCYDYGYIKDIEPYCSCNYSNYYDKEKIAFMKSECNKMYGEVKKLLPKNASDYQKAGTIAQYIFDTITYDLDYNSYSPGYGKQKNNTDIYNAYKYHRTTCGGFAYLFNDLCKKFNVTAYYVTGKTNRGFHAWCVVVFDGYAYQMDYTYLSGGYNDPICTGKGKVDEIYKSYWKYYKTPNLNIAEDANNIHNVENAEWKCFPTKEVECFIDKPELWKRLNKIESLKKSATVVNVTKEELQYVIMSDFVDDNGYTDTDILDFMITTINDGYLYYPRNYLLKDGSFNKETLNYIISYTKAFNEADKSKLLHTFSAASADYFVDKNGNFNKQMADIQAELLRMGYLLFPQRFLIPGSGFNINCAENYLKYAADAKELGFTIFSEDNSSRLPCYYFANENDELIYIREYECNDYNSSLMAKRARAASSINRSIA